MVIYKYYNTLLYNKKVIKKDYLFLSLNPASKKTWYLFKCISSSYEEVSPFEGRDLTGWLGMTSL